MLGSENKKVPSHTGGVGRSQGMSVPTRALRRRRNAYQFDSSSDILVCCDLPFRPAIAVAAILGSSADTVLFRVFLKTVAILGASCIRAIDKIDQ